MTSDFEGYVEHCRSKTFHECPYFKFGFFCL